MNHKPCKDCGIVYPETREYFGQYKNTRNGATKIGYRNSCRKCMAANTRRYDSENPENALARRLRREQQTTSNGGEYSISDIQALREKLEDKCRFCGCALNQGGDIEHLTPVARGGTSNANNLTLACHKCNKEKTSKTLAEYLQWREERGLFVRKVGFVETPDEPLIAKGRRSYR